MATQLGLFSSVGVSAETTKTTTKKERRNTPTNTTFLKDYFVATDEMGIGTGGAKEKFKQNIAAIRIMRWAAQIEGTANEKLTQEDRIKLARYNGWGPVASVFTDDRKWRNEQAELRRILSLEEYKHAQASVLNAYYTDPIIVKEMWRWVQRMGFPGGKVLEPAVGSGLFFSYMPLVLQKRSRMVGIDLDPISANITKYLHTSAKVHNTSFENAPYGENYFDLAISNVPFGQLRMVDRAFNKFPFLLKSVHNYYFAKALRLVRDGGLIVFITSRYTMDAKDSSVRQYLSERSRLIASIRLPSNAFVENAGTHVTTDIIILQKDAGGSTGWVDSVDEKDRQGNTYRINKYYKKHPHMIMGEMVCDGRGLYGNIANCVMPNDENLWHMLQNVLPYIPTKIYKPKTIMFASLANDKPNIPDTPWLRDGSYFEDTVSMAMWQYDMNGEHKRVETRRDKLIAIRAFVKVRDAARAVIVANQEHVGDAELRAAQSKLEKEYAEFKRAHGALSRDENRSATREDPDSVLIQALLERWDAKKKVATKTSFFTERRIGVTKQITSVETIEEALNLSLVHNIGKIDIEEISSLVSKTRAEVTAYLIENKLAFVSTNDESRLVSADEYLSGNVREKLTIAREAAKGNIIYENNVKALEQVLPRRLGRKDIAIQPGAYWLSHEIIEDFIKSIGGVNPSAIYIAPIGKWRIKVPFGNGEMDAKYGTRRMDAAHILELMLNNTQPTIYDTMLTTDGKKVKVYNPKDTVNARAQQDKLKRYWYKWIWSDEDRAVALEDEYNVRFRSTVPREYAIKTTQIKGIGANIKLRRNQERIVYRGLTSNRVLIAHKVGFGKTWSMQAAGMMRRMMGLSKRVVYVVPNHMIDSNQFLGEFLELFPSANILSLTSADVTRAKRQRVIARILAEDYDAIIISHTAFTMLPTRAETQQYVLTQMLDKLIKFKTKNMSSIGKRELKELEKSKRNLEAKIHQLGQIGNKDNMLTWEDLDVDALFVDEAHLFKNLWFPTSLGRISGVGGSASGRAFDLYVKTRGLLKKDGFLGFATGTPISNSISEMYIMMLYMMEEKLIEMGLDFFDSWASVFAEVVSEMEMKPSGLGWRIHNRMSRYKNVGEMKRLWLEFADVEMDWRKTGMVVPKIKTGSPIVVSSPASPELIDYIKQCNDRFENLDKVDPKDDNPLVIINDARQASTDIRLKIPNAPDYPDSKLNKAGSNIVDIYRKTTGVELVEKGKVITANLTQIVFLDTSTPKKDEFNLHYDLRDKLVAAGIPREEIALIHDYDKRKKISLFDAVNNGTVRILIGTTGKMGVGTNVQRLLYAIHHIDPTWKPANIVQRDGRIVRQGNLNDTVEIYRYVTQDSFDVYFWQTLERKARMVAQVVDNNDLEVREVEEIGRIVADYTMVKVIAANDPLLMRKAEVDARLAELQYIERDREEREAELNAMIADGEINIKKAFRITENLRNIKKPLDQTELMNAATKLEEAIAKHWKRLTFTERVCSVFGLDVFIRKLNGGSESIIIKTSAWEETVIPIKSVMRNTIAQQLYAALSDPEQMANEEESRINMRKKSVAAQIAELNAPFEYRDELDSLIAESRKIEEKLNKIKEEAEEHAQRITVAQ